MLPPPEASTLPRPRFFWPGLLVALPLLILAGLAAAGLRLRWQARLVEAQEEGRRTVDRVAAEVDHVMSDATRRARTVRLYADPPVPPPAAEVSPDWKKAVESGELTKLTALRDAAAPTWTEAGLPVAALAAWEVFSRDSSPENAAALVETVVVRWPSAVSTVILDKASGFAKTKGPVPQTLLESPSAWAVSESLRALVRRHPPEGDGRDAKNGSHESHENDNSPASHPSHSPPAAPPGEWLSDAGRLWFFHRANGETAIADATDALRNILGGGEKSGIPDWMAVSLWKDGKRLELAGKTEASLFTGPPPALAPDRIEKRRSPDSGAGTDGLELAEHRGLVNVRAELSDPDRLYAPLRAEIAWASALIGAATLSAGGGLWLSRRALQREERLHTLKSQFVASVSHELRAPIGSVRLMAEALAAGTVDGEVSRTFYRLLAQEGQRLSALIENVLDFARMESGRKAYQFEETDIAALLRDTIALLEPRAAPRGIVIQLELQPLPQVPEVDALAVQQAVMNLLDNALKFSPDQSVITVTLAEEPPGGWSMAIADEGPGIPVAEHRRIFERFHRLGNELRRETQGAGIGLSLVQHIAEGHGGRVTVKNREPRGSVFTLHFSGEGKGFRFQGSEPDR